jgi:hypothetical protein
MAGREQEVMELKEEYIKKGCNIDQIDNTIEAWVLSKLSLGKLRASLDKLNRETKKNYSIPVASQETPFIPTLKNTYSNSQNLNESYEDISLKIKNNLTLTNQTFFLEDQEMIELQLEQHREELHRFFKENYQFAEYTGNETPDQDIWVVGRVELRDDDDDDEYFLVTKIETYRLSLNEISDFAIFPGQVILVGGRIQNADIIVKNIITDPRKDLRIPVNLTSKLKIAVFSGPFTDSSLDFNHFFTTVSQVSKQVNLIIIVGPIVDCENEKIKSFSFKAPNSNIENCTYEQLLDTVLRALNSIKSCKILIVPHERETCHLFPLPMPELRTCYASQVENSIFPENLLTCQAPGFIEVNGLNIHIVPFDIVREISNLLNLKPQYGKNKIQIAMNQLIQQGTYLPVIPNNLPVEYTKFMHFCPESLPNILILNSELSVKFNSIPGVTCVKMIDYYDKKNIGNYSVITSVPGENELLVSLKEFRA